MNQIYKLIIVNYHIMLMNMSTVSETITCGACGETFHSDEEKADHIRKAHKK
jgi:hypothetical protein